MHPPKCTLLLTIYAGPLDDISGPPADATNEGSPVPPAISREAPTAAAPANPPSTEGPTDGSQLPIDRDPQIPQQYALGWGPPPVPLHGPHFRALRKSEQAELIRVHNNLGHPAPERLSAHLRAIGAADAIVQAARDYVCDACVESAHSSISRPAKLHEPTEFNQVVGIDGFFWRGQAGFQIYVVHFIDECSCFHLGRRVDSRHTSSALPAFQDAWLTCAGAPKEMYVDPAGELRSTEMWTALQSMNIQAFVTAEAWQRGHVERHGQVIKQMLTRLDQDVPLSNVSDVDAALAQCFRAFRGSGGVSQVIDLEEHSQEPNNVPSPNEVITTHEPSGPSGILRPNTVLEPLHAGVNGPPETAESEEGLTQPEQGLTPQVSAQAGATGPPATDGAAPLSDVDPAASVPLPDDSVDGLVSVDEPILLAEVHNEDESSAERFELIPSQSDHGQSILLAEDDLPWHETPLQHEAHQKYCIDIPLTPKDCKRWLQDPKPESLAHIAAAGKKARVEVRVKDPSPEELRLFARTDTSVSLGSDLETS